VVQIIRQTLMATFWLAAPLLAIGFMAGLAISLVQIATSMQDNAFSTIPRLLAFLGGLLFLLPWMLHRMMGYTIALFGDLGRYAR
jgi:flagellar biosynthetic protein FliQ